MQLQKVVSSLSETQHDLAIKGNTACTKTAAGGLNWGQLREDWSWG